MRKSSQLRLPTSQCANNADIDLSYSSLGLQRAGVIKGIVKRILNYEEIPDIRAEIESLLYQRHYKWENYTQKEENITKYEKIINGYLNELGFMRNRMISLQGVDRTIDVFGETIEVNPDFVVDNGDSIVIGNITTGKGDNVNGLGLESYALGEFGKRLFPDKKIVLEYHALHINRNYNPNNVKPVIRSYEYTDQVKSTIEEINSKKEASVCDAAACATCPKNQICNYTEPPIAEDIASAVKPIGSIRLTQAQQNIVDFETGIARVNAGAGAGKTLVVALRVAELLSKGYEPEDFLLLTFTKAGAEEMTARAMTYAAEQGTPLDPSRFTSSTINAFCQNIVSENYQQLGFTRPPRVVPDEIKMSIIQDIIGNQLPKIPEWDYISYQDMRKWNPFLKGLALNEACKLFDEIKVNGYTRTSNPFQLTPESIGIIFDAFDIFESTLKERNLLEYSDQLRYTMQLFEANPTMCQDMGYKHIIVDEFQDTDLHQIHFLNKMMDTTAFKSFMAVGDDSQSIFGFRHTSPEFMINFQNYFGVFTDFSLEDNHRSNANIITLANRINDLANDKVDKVLSATKQATSVPTIKGCYTEKEEYDWIANDIKKRWDSGERDIAVLASTKFELQKIADALSSLEIPSTLMCPIHYKDNSRVAALTSFYTSFFSNSSQGLADYQNALKNGALKYYTTEQINQTVEEFKEELSDTPKSLKSFMRFAKALDEEGKDVCYQSFIEKLEYCENTAELKEFMSAFDLYGDHSDYKREGRYEGVSLTTVHSAKGLEWDTTYLTLSKFDKISNHTHNFHAYTQSPAYDEDIRKWFVGVTRARENLIMTGNFLIKRPTSRSNTIEFNDFVLKSYELLGKPLDYTYGNYVSITTKEKLEEKEKQDNTYKNVRMKHSSTIDANIEKEQEVEPERGE